MAVKHAGIGKLIYYSEKDFAVVKRKAKAANLDVTKYIRKMSIDGAINVYDFKEANNLIYEIHKIGVNVNQLAKKANEINSIYKVDLDTVKKEYDSLCLMLNQYLSELQSTKV